MVGNYFTCQAALIEHWHKHLTRNGIKMDSNAACRLFIVKYSHLFRKHFDERVLHLPPCDKPMYHQ